LPKRVLFVKALVNYVGCGLTVETAEQSSDSYQLFSIKCERELVCQSETEKPNIAVC